MAACDESLTLQAQLDAAKSARVAMAAEEARAASEVDLSLLHRELKQAASLQAAALQQRLRILAERAAKETSTAVNRDGHSSAASEETAARAKQSAAEHRDAVGNAAQEHSLKIEDELWKLETGVYLQSSAFPHCTAGLTAAWVDLKQGCALGGATQDSQLLGLRSHCAKIAMCPQQHQDPMCL